MESLFERVENLGAWDSYIRSCQTVGVTDEELSAAMIDATFNSNDELLHRLTTGTKSGRRVFKQLCLKGRIPFVVYIDLLAREESDLAFNLIVGLGMWSFVLELYAHEDVTQRSRRHAFQRAIREGAWETVTQMAACRVTCGRDRREAFLAAVRRGQFSWAVQLCREGAAVADGDLRFAVKTCFATGQHGSAIEFLKCCRSDEKRGKVLKLILKEAIHAGSVVLVGNAPSSNKFDFAGSSGVVETAIGAAWCNMTVEIDLVNSGNSAHFSKVCIGENHTVSVFVNKLPAADSFNMSTEDTDDTEGSRWLLRYLIRQTVSGNNAECFKGLCQQLIDQGKNVQYAFKKAFEGGRPHLVTHVIDDVHCICFQHFTLLSLAIKLAVRSENWEFIRNVSEVHQRCFPWLNHLVTETNLLRKSKNWPFLVPIVERFIEKKIDVTDDLSDTFSVGIGINSRKAKHLAKWCEENSFSHLALCLSVETKDWLMAKRITESLENPMCLSLFNWVLEESLIWGAWNVASACLKHAPTDEMDTERFGWMDVAPLIRQCRTDGMKDWVIKLAAWTHEWQIVQTEMESCDDESILNFVLQEAATTDQWQVVSTLLTRCTGSEPCLHDVLTSAIEMDEYAVAKTLLNMISPLSGNSDFGSILHIAVESENAEEMVLLCIEAGVSTHRQQEHDLFWSPMNRALTFAPGPQFSVVRALFESGACSHGELRHIMNDPFIKSRLKIRNQTKILQFMEEAVRRPHSLQNLCRLSVSHLIGCWPGRKNRISSLPVPQCIKDFIMFNDLGEPV